MFSAARHEALVMHGVVEPAVCHIFPGIRRDQKHNLEFGYRQIGVDIVPQCAIHVDVQGERAAPEKIAGRVRVPLVPDQAKTRGEFELSLLNIQESAEYFVESDGIRSEVFKLEVVDLPFVKQLDLVLNFPAFARMAAKTIEDGGDVAALKGTVVTLTAHLSGKARAARIVLADGRKTEGGLRRVKTSREIGPGAFVPQGD